jgi:hypothetical protein
MSDQEQKREAEGPSKQKHSNGRLRMEKPPSNRKRPEISAEERAKHDLIKQMLKLRWMGMEKEA